MTQLNFGSFNVRGIKKKEHNDRSRSLILDNILSDIKKQNIDAIGIQESHFGQAEYLQKECGYECFFVNSEGNNYHGAGIIVKSIYNPSFNKVSDRVCTANFSIDNKHFLLVSGYAPHEELANSCDEEIIRKTFYNELQKALVPRTSTTIVIMALDANAKTSYHPDTHSNVIGHFTKGNEINNNGTWLMQFASQNELFLTNTKFRHKMSRRSTWSAPYKPIMTSYGKIRRNPVRNQIDYILINKRHLQFVTNSRSYNNTQTISDHNLVIMNLRLELNKLRRPKKDPIPEINIENFKKPSFRESYQSKIIEIQNSETEKCTKGSDIWLNVVNTCNEAGKETLGMKERTKKNKENKEISNLKERRQSLRTNMNSCNSVEVRKQMTNQIKDINKKIPQVLKEAEEKEVDDKLKHLESIKDDNTKYYYVMREIQNHNKNNKSAMIVKDKNGNVPGSNLEKIKVIEEYFKSTLAPIEMEDEFLTVPPCEMKKKFTADEIESLAKRLNIDKAAGPDKLKAEFIKYAPKSTYQQIAEIFNIAAATGEYPEALVQGLLHPVPKPGKKKGPQENLRPIILLSILRKILTIALLERT